MASSQTSQTAALKVAWEKLPEDFKLPDDPVDNVNQPALGDLELYQLQDNGLYTIQVMAENGLYWVDTMRLFHGVVLGVGICNG